MECRFCLSDNTIKSGKVRQKQRYKCKACNKHFITHFVPRGIDINVKLQALALIKEGVAFRAVARLIKVSLSAVLKWFKNKALIIKQIVNNQSIDQIKEIDVVEIDEMWHYTQKKQRKIWIWFAVSRTTRRVLAIEVGSRGKKTLRSLLSKLKGYKIRTFCTDHWRIYRSLIPEEQVIQSKKQTTVVESINCNVRHYLARFRRRSRCYSKSPEMVELACYFLFESHLTIF